MARQTLQNTEEFCRLMALPRRKLTSDAAEQLARIYTKLLRRKGGTRTLQKEQGASLHEIELNAKLGRGAVLMLPVGKGKTDIGFLAPVLLKSERTALISEHALEGQTHDDWSNLYRHWKSPRNPIKFISWESITSRHRPNLLGDYNPKVLIIDESDGAAAWAKSRAARIDRFRLEHPKAIIICMTATPSRMSLLGYGHHLVWSLKDGAPVPRDRHELEMLAALLDEKVRDPLSRPLPGPWGSDREAALKRFARRLRETQGVVIFDEDSCKQSLTIEFLQASPCKEIDHAFEQLLLRGRNLAGVPVTDALSRYRCESQMGCGLISEYDDPKPPEAWIHARRALARFVRRKIARSRYTGHPLDTTAQVLSAYKHHEVIKAWEAVREYKPKMKVIWFSDQVVKDAKAWLKQQKTPSIIWCGSKPLGKKIAAELRIPYFGAGGRGSTGLLLHEFAKLGGHMVCSWQANKKGFNLQAWHNQIIIIPPQSAKWLEQWLGRTHRAKQNKPVKATILVTSGVIVDAFHSALREARHCKKTVSLTQKILRAKIKLPTLKGSSYRWSTGEDRVSRQDNAV